MAVPVAVVLGTVVEVAAAEQIVEQSHLWSFDFF